MGTRILNAPASRAAQQSAKGIAKLPLQSPWQGYTPDMAIPGTNPSGLTSCRGLVVVAGVLTPDHGWTRIGPADLPLGNANGVAPGYTNAGTSYGAGLAPFTGAGDEVAQPVRHLAAFQRFKGSTGIGSPDIMAVTVDTQGPNSGLGVQETGHLFAYSGGAWNSIEFSAQTATSAGPQAPPQLVGAAPLTGTIDNWVDSTVYPLGITGGTVAGNTIHPVAQSVFIFTNYVDEVMYTPVRDTAPGEAHYAPFSSYAGMIGQVGAVSAFYSGAGSIFTSLRAKTVATFDGRVWYGNTVEGGVFFGTRLRRSIVGNPLIVWSGFEISDPAPLNLNGVGAGFIDLEQLKTPIQRVLPLGDLLAVYSKDGVALVRRTGSQPAPYAIQYLTLERGVLSPGSVVAISPAQHFAIMGDGWYLINANGTIQEVGVQKPHALTTGEVNNKWKEDFYTRLSSEGVGVDQLQLGYEPEEQFVRVSLPMGAGGEWKDNVGAPPLNNGTSHIIANEVWIYDIKNDRVFLDNYQGVNNQDESPVCWAVVIRPLGEFVSWDDITGGTATPWDALDDPGSWDSLSPSFGGHIVVHGDTNGCVYMHDHAVTTVDGDQRVWSFVTVAHNYGVPGGGERMLQRIDIQYENNEASTSQEVQVTVEGFTNDSGASTSSGVSESNAIDLRRGEPSEMAYEYGHYKVTGDHHRISMAGTGQVKFHSIELEFQQLEGRYRRREGS